MKLQEGSNDQKLITVPRQLCRAMGWEKGDELEWSVDDDSTLRLSKND